MNSKTDDAKIHSCCGGDKKYQPLVRRSRVKHILSKSLRLRVSYNSISKVQVAPVV